MKVRKVFSFVVFGLLFIVAIIKQYNVFAENIAPLIDSPGKTIGSDFNGDGIHDFIVGARGADKAYIVFGSNNIDGTIDVGGGPLSPDVTFLSRGAGQLFGDFINSTGDLNGDGLDDIAMSALNNDENGAEAGLVYIFFGATNLSGTKNLGGVQSADMTILGKEADNYMGNSASTAGDINGDGFDDVVVGAARNDDGATRAGAAYVFFGAANLGGTKNLGGVASSDVTFLGAAAYDYLGTGVAAVGDMNGDGFDDLIMGARGNDSNGALAGTGYIFFGASNISGTKDTGNADEDVRIIGKAGGDVLGATACGSGDVNGDGFDDAIIPAPKNDDGPGTDAGAAYVIFGSSSLSGTFDTSGGVQSPNLTIIGKAATDFLGYGPGIAGDINDDGYDDILIGAMINDDGPGVDSGALYVFFGSSSIGGTKELGGGDSADLTFLGKAASDQFGERVSGIGDVNADGIADFVVSGAANDDGGTNNEGAAYIFFGATNLSGTKSLGEGASADVTLLGDGNTAQLGRGVGGGRGNPGP